MSRRWFGGLSVPRRRELMQDHPTRAAGLPRTWPVRSRALVRTEPARPQRREAVRGQETQIPGTSTLRNRCGLTVAVSG